MLQPDSSGDAPARGGSSRAALLSSFSIVLALGLFLSGVLVGAVGSVGAVRAADQRGAAHDTAQAAASPPAPVEVRDRPVPPDPNPTVRATVRRTATPAQPVHHAAKPARHARGRRWLPTGTGMWTYLWNRTAHGNAAQVVRRARWLGIDTLYVRTGTSATGFSGAPVLRRLLPRTRHTGVRVVAWDFPLLSHPREEARRLARAARYRAPGKGTPRIAAVAPDIETPAEGTHTSARAVIRYLRALRHDLPKGTAILATVPWPSEVRRGRYPYEAVATHADALIPMAYWYNRSPSAVTAFSVRWLRRFHKPVLPVGQGYDSRLDAPYLPHSNQRREVRAFLRTARHLHVRAVSLWVWQTAGPAQWDALRAYRRAFRLHWHHAAAATSRRDAATVHRRRH